MYMGHLKKNMKNYLNMYTMITLFLKQKLKKIKHTKKKNLKNKNIIEENDKKKIKEEKIGKLKKN